MTCVSLRRLVPLVLGSCVALGVAPISNAAEELRIGMIAPTTGILAQVGKDMVDGLNMYLEETGGTFAGAKVKLIVEDSQGKPDTAVTKAKKLILQDKVHMLLGGVLATEGYALAPVSTNDKTVYIVSVPAADDLTQRDLPNYPYLIRTGWTSSQPHHPLGQWACEQGYKKIVAIGADYAFGHESVGGFQKTFEDCGGQIIQKIWPPFGTKDFGPYIPTIKADADAIFTLMVGPMVVQFPKQLRAAGIKKPIVGGGTSYDEFALPVMGDEVIGDVSSFMYSAAIETPKNEAFVKKYRTAYGKVPSYYSEANYTTAQWIDEFREALKQIDEGARNQPMIADVGSVQVLVVNGDTTDSGWSVSVDGASPSRHTGKTAAIAGLLTGDHAIRVAATVAGKAARAESIASVKSGAVTTVEVSLE